MSHEGQKHSADPSGGGDPPAAKVGKTKAAKTISVRVKGGEQPINILINDLEDVSDLKEKVKEKFPTLLKEVDVGCLTLHQSEEIKTAGGQALKPGMVISNIQGGQDDDNPLYVHYDGPTAGGGAGPSASSSGVQGVSPYQTVEKDIKADKYKLPHVPSLSRTLIQREVAIERLARYIKTSIGNGGQADKFPLLGSARMTGIGKTSMLLHGLYKVVPQLALRNRKVQAAYLTFNGQGNAKGACEASHPTARCISRADSFGHALLELCGVGRDLATQLSFSNSLQFYRQMLKITEEDTSFVLFVDEIGFLGNEEAKNLLSELMAEMDSREGKLLFFFTRIS